MVTAKSVVLVSIEWFGEHQIYTPVLFGYQNPPYPYHDTAFWADASLGFKNDNWYDDMLVKYFLACLNPSGAVAGCPDTRKFFEKVSGEIQCTAIETLYREKTGTFKPILNNANIYMDQAELGAVSGTGLTLINVGLQELSPSPVRLIVNIFFSCQWAIVY